MNLQIALREMADTGNLDAEQLIAYADEDTVSGCEDGYYSNISVSRDEGKILYALVRAMRPNLIIEVGCHSGCSTTHMLRALEKNEKGQIISVDFNGMVDPGIPPELAYRWSQVITDARYYEWPSGVDMLFEDADHTRDLTEKVVKSAIDSGARVVLSHDAYNESVGNEVQYGFAAGAGAIYTVLIDGPRLGLAYWFKKA